MVDRSLQERLREFGEAVLDYLFARESGDESAVPELKHILQIKHSALSGSGGHVSLYL